MCGILCVLQSPQGGEAVLPQVLERVRRIRHRGPDWSGVHVSGDSVLAHERLAIVDVDAGAQPLRSRDSTMWLSINGELYNHRQLRSELAPADRENFFRTGSDCEIVLPLYAQAEARGEDPTRFLNRLNGIFAFVLSDERPESKRFIAARDHMGIVPLYMGRDAHGALWFASELKALADVCTSFEDFPPGHVYDSRVGKLIKWYEPAWHDEINFLPTTPVDLNKLRDTLEQAVVRQMMGDVPWGVLLSGGLDSSLIASIAARHCQRRIEDGSAPATGPELHSFSVGLADSPDLKAARTVADSLGTVHHEFVFTVEEGLHAVSDVIYHLETYDVTTIRAATPMYIMSRRIKQLGVKMVLSGEGSDEIFGGYLYFHKCPSAKEHQMETVRKLKGLHKWDCLRANKSTMAWGVEVRVPFLDKEFIDYAMTEIRPEDKMCGRMVDGRIEKWCVREAFKGYLPESILWRQKEQFSDGVGYNWIDSLRERAERVISDADFAAREQRFPYNTPATKEAYFIRQIFEQYFPQESARECVPGGPSIACSTPAAVLWDASFQKFADCSGRSVAGVHTSAYDDQQRKIALGKEQQQQAAESAAAGAVAAAAVATAAATAAAAALFVEPKAEPNKDAALTKDHPLSAEEGQAQKVCA